MKSCRSLVALSVMLLAMFLTACTSKPQEPAAPKLDEPTAIDLLWKYEMALMYKLSDPTLYVTGTEKQWLDKYLADKAAGNTQMMSWTVSDAIVSLVKTGAKESFAQTAFKVGEKEYRIQFRLIPVDGAWKIENHQLPDGKWWAPQK